MSRPAASRIQKIRDLTQSAADAGDAEAAEITAALDRVLAEGGSVDDALGLRSAPGHPSWSTVAARARRDAAIKELWCGLHRIDGIDVRLQRLSTTIRNYAAIGWITDRRVSVLPDRYNDSERAALFAVFKSTDGDVPSSEKQLRRILEL